MYLESVFDAMVRECVDASPRSLSTSASLWLGLFVLVVGPTLVVAQRRDAGATLKEYSGVRARSDSHRQVYYYDQTIAVVELGPGKELENCELIEVYADVQLALQMKNLSSISRPILVSFSQMKELMNQCQFLEAPTVSTEPTGVIRSRSLQQTDVATERAMPATINPLSLLSGILPGTKWCGTGDIADTYFDLGEMSSIDKCCRTHDLCPTKVRAFTSRYNLTNYSIYTKSHCTCDGVFYDCLKATKNPTANVMGNIYFNIVRVPCIEDSGCEGMKCLRRKQFKTARKHF